MLARQSQEPPSARRVRPLQEPAWSQDSQHQQGVPSVHVARDTARNGPVVAPRCRSFAGPPPHCPPDQLRQSARSCVLVFSNWHVRKYGNDNERES